MKYVLLITLLAGCSHKTEDKPKPTPAEPAKAPAAAVTVPDTLTFADGTPEAQLRTFCMGNYEKMLSCFEDAAFWDVLSTLFFAQNLKLDDGTSTQREAWIGMRKDDLASLKRENRIQADCEAAIKHTMWPSADDQAKVVAARKESCPAFANAFGRMVFVNRAFFDPRPK